MATKKLNILLVEDNAGDAHLIREILSYSDHLTCDVTHAVRLGDAIELAAANHFNLILLDLSLPDGWGIESFVKLHSRVPNVPIVVLTMYQDERLAVKVIREGAQDFLIKAELKTHLLERAIAYAIERHNLLQEMQVLTLVDDLTGLYNRRGFLTLGEQILRMAERKEEQVMMALVDVDDLKQINQEHGRTKGDEVLLILAQALQRTFRKSDLVSRLVSDEFAVMATEAEPNNSSIITERLRECLDEIIAERNFGIPFDFSIGRGRFDPKTPSGLQEILAHADSLMYEQKRRKDRDKLEAIARKKQK